MNAWLAVVKHDLLKHALWCARDLRSLGELAQPPRVEDIAALRRSLLEVLSSEGDRVTALALWRELRAESSASPAALDAFEAVLAAAQSAVFGLDTGTSSGRFQAALAAVLRLEAAFAALSEHLGTPLDS